MMAIVSSGLTRHDRDKLPDMHKWIDDFKALAREPQKNFLNYVLHTTRQAIAGQSLPGASELNEGFQQNWSEVISKKLDVIRCEHFYHLVQKAHYEVGRNAHPKILAFHLLLSLARLFRNDEPVAAIEADYLLHN